LLHSTWDGRVVQVSGTSLKIFFVILSPLKRLEELSVPLQRLVELVVEIVNLLLQRTAPGAGVG
jgi:hypothetical protein